MSVPPINYNIPPPRLDHPPPVPSPAVPPSQLYSHPPPFPIPTVPAVDQLPPYVLPPLNVPPPSLYSSDILKQPPPVSAYPPPAIPSDYPYQGHSIETSFKSQPEPNLQVTSSYKQSSLHIEVNKNLSPNVSDRIYHEHSSDRRSSSKSSSDRYHRLDMDYPSSFKHRYSPHRERSYDRSRERYREYRHREYRLSRSPSYSRRHRSRSPSSHSYRDSRERYYSKYDHHRRYEYERRRSPHYRDYRSHSRSYDSHYDRRCRSPSRLSYCSSSRDSHHRSRARDLSPHSRHESAPRKPLTDREKILEEFRKNYCKTSEDFIERMEQWSKEHNSDEEENSKMWYRSSPAELYYKAFESGVQQTNKLEKLCDTFFKTLIERGRNARPEVDELPPLKPPKAKMCNKHTLEERSSSSCESDDCLDEDGLQGYTDRIMLELQRKQSHPRRLHPEMWFNNTGQMNGGPLCRCSARARRHGMRHGVYAGEQSFPKCIPTHSNINKLYHYRITVSPPTNFLIKAPTIIGHDEHEFLFSGFSMFSHYKLAKLPTCKVIRFNIEYTILYVEEPAPQNFTIRELDLFEEYLFTELLELVDLDLGKATDVSCSQFHFMPRFVRYLPEGGCEVLSMCEVLKYLIDESGLLIPPETLEDVHNMDHYTWQKFVDRIKGMIVTYPGKKPCSIRVDQLDRSPPISTKDVKNPKELKSFYPEIVHFGIRPPQLSYAGNPEYQKAWRYYVKYRHLIANMAKPSFKEKQKLAAKEAKLQEMRTQSKMKRDVTVAISSEGFHTTGLMCDVVQHAMLIPVLVRHLRFHKSLDSLEKKIGYVFEQRLLLQTALTHPSYRENFGTNPDHARNSLTNCGIRQPEYGDRKIHYTRKKGIVTLINIMSRFGKHNETESEIKHNERLEFLGDAVVEFLSSIHLFRMFPGLTEGGLATYRASIVQNQHLAQLAKNISLEQFMLYAHGSDLCREVVMRHAMANCFEALMGALFLDAGLEVADRVFALALWYSEPDLLEVWTKERAHPLQEQEPLGDRKYIKDFEFLQRLTEFEESIGVVFKHIRLLARAFTDRSVGFTHLTLGSNQRLEFLGDTVLQLVVSDRLYRYFPDHHEGHLSLLRSSLVNKRTQAMVCDDLNMSAYAIYNNPKAKPTTKKHKADLLEAFLGALFIDKNLEYCQAFCNACLFPRLQEFIMNQAWNDPKSKLQQCCLTLRSMEGGEPDIPLYKVIKCLGPTNTRVYEVGVYFRGTRLASACGHSIQEAEMNAAEHALAAAHELFPQLDHQKRVIAKSMKKKSRHGDGHESPSESSHSRHFENRVPKAYRLNKDSESSDDSSVHASPPSDDDSKQLDKSDIDDSDDDKSDDDSGLVSDTESTDKLENVKVSSLLSDMEKIKEDLIRRNEYEKLKEKCKRSDSDDD
ncbi:ribonuclease 3 [Galleria mellonella]|uniref:Ribonuclease 3 n=1 Tax=Galleria mellonella TaxID=7137 RepID=A0ABM3MH47_GALME|nr:ribonuclease 3 [Galleria mellonella]